MKLVVMLREGIIPAATRFKRIPAPTKALTAQLTARDSPFFFSLSQLLNWMNSSKPVRSA